MCLLESMAHICASHAFIGRYQTKCSPNKLYNLVLHQWVINRLSFSCNHMKLVFYFGYISWVASFCGMILYLSCFLCVSIVTRVSSFVNTPWSFCHWPICNFLIHVKEFLKYALSLCLKILFLDGIFGYIEICNIIYTFTNFQNSNFYFEMF